MNVEQWHKISEVFEAALGYPAEQRAAFLGDACSGDDEVARRVQAMLEADGQTDLFIDRPAYKLISHFDPATLAFDESQSFSGDMIGDYRLIRELGRGGMGSVYLGYDTRLERQAAVKLLPSRFNSPERVRRLQREARSASALNHPNIITIYDFGQDNGRDFIASEYVEGSTLRDYVGKPEFTLKRVLDVAIQVASALETAHAAGIIHRDIKPENIMLRPDGYAKVLDFGLAKLTESHFDSDEAKPKETAATSAFETRTGMVLGTVNYMSPEQVRGQKLDGRSDLFSLGVVLYELITGQRPFRGETFHHTMVAITDSEPLPISRHVPGSPSALQKIITRVLAKNRDDRYQNAHDLLLDLEALQAELVAKRVEQKGTVQPYALPISEQTTNLLAPVSAGGDSGTGIVPVPAVPLAWPKLTKLRQRTAVIAISIMMVAAALVYCGWKLAHPSPVLSNKDTILLADFVNNTGDPDFDGTLKQGLTVQLEQSPYINIFPEERARETLKLMERPRDEKITREIGREICERRGIKALMVGTIARLGRNYVITLEAINSSTGEAIAQQQMETESKEEVLKTLGRATTQMREKLGESLASIQQFDVPIEQATTASLEAFKSYIAGAELRRKGKYADSIPQFKRAVELDAEFAEAYTQLGASYRDTRNLAFGNQYLERAYQLRDRVSEREKLSISATYFRYITGELDKRTEATSLLTRTYPQDPYGHHIHGNSLMIAGEFEQAAESYRRALRLDNDFSTSRANLALALIGLNRFDEARQLIKEGMERGQDYTNFHSRLYLLAFLGHDESSMAEQVAWFTGRPEEYQIREHQARALASAGKLREARESLAKAAALAEARHLPAEKARILANEANLNATFGMIPLAQKEISLLLSLLDDEGISPEEVQTSLIQQLDSQPLAWTVALCGDVNRAESLDNAFTTKFPLDTIHNSVWQPLVRSTIELKRAEETHNPAMTDRAIQMLPPSRQYEAALYFRPTWVRGQAYLQAKNGSLAATEFQRIIDHRGWDALSPLWSLAHLGLARAEVLQGDSAKARKAYEDFFLLWKDADADLPVLIEARK